MRTGPYSFNNPSDAVIKAAARNAAKRDLGDPFVYARAIAAMKAGHLHPTDFNRPVVV